LEDCHTSHPLRKFLGACNGAKALLDRCLSHEYLVKRELNAEKAKAAKRSVRQDLEEDKHL